MYRYAFNGVRLNRVGHTHAIVLKIRLGEEGRAGAISRKEFRVFSSR